MWLPHGIDIWIKWKCLNIYADHLKSVHIERIPIERGRDCQNNQKWARESCTAIESQDLLLKKNYSFLDLDEAKKAYIWLLWYIFQFCLVKVHVCKVYKVDLLQSSFRAFLTRCISAILSKQVKGQKTNQHYHLHPMIMITPHPSSHDHDHNFLQVGGVGFTAIRESQ